MMCLLIERLLCGSPFSYFISELSFLIICWKPSYILCWLLQCSQVKPYTYSSFKEPLIISSKFYMFFLFCYSSLVSTTFYTSVSLIMRSKNYSFRFLLTPQNGHSISTIITPSNRFSKHFANDSIKNRPNSIESCWKLFWNSKGEILRMFVGLIYCLFDFKRSEKSLWIYPKGRTVSRANNAKFLPWFGMLINLCSSFTKTYFSTLKVLDSKILFRSYLFMYKHWRKLFI